MLVPDAQILELLLVALLVDLVKDLHEAPVIGLQDCIFGRQVQRPAHTL